MDNSELAVALAQLYLRLAGFFLVGFIVHGGQKESIRAEIDIIAVRFPGHSEIDIDFEKPGFLGLSERDIDVLVCEVKSSIGKFNASFQKESVAERVVNRVGAWTEGSVVSIADHLRLATSDGAATKVASTGISLENRRFRALYVCPTTTAAEGTDRWILDQKEIFRFLNERLLRWKPRPNSIGAYDYEQWGAPFAKIVRVMKKKRISSFDDLHAALKDESAASNSPT